MPRSLRASVLRIVMASAVSALGRLIIEPVTTISCNSGSGDAEGACCPIAVTAHRDAPNALAAAKRRIKACGIRSGFKYPPDELSLVAVPIGNLQKFLSDSIGKLERIMPPQRFAVAGNPSIARNHQSQPVDVAPKPQAHTCMCGTISFSSGIT